MSSDIDKLKMERDGHLFWGRKVELLKREPPMWLVERDENGMPVRMRWTGYVPKRKQVRRDA